MSAGANCPQETQEATNIVMYAEPSKPEAFQRTATRKIIPSQRMLFQEKTSRDRLFQISRLKQIEATLRILNLGQRIQVVPL